MVIKEDTPGNCQGNQFSDFPRFNFKTNIGIVTAVIAHAL